MAGVTDGRGQLILVTGFALALTFVAFALLLNSVIVTENLASRGDTAGASTAVTLRQDTINGTNQIIRLINDLETDKTTSGYSGLDDALTEGIGDMSRLIQQTQPASGQAAAVSLETLDEGSWIEQADDTQDYTDKDGRVDWTVTSSAGGVRAMQFTVSDVTTLAGDASTGFEVDTEDRDGDTWRLWIYNPSGGDPTVEIEHSDGSTVTCTTTSSSFVVDVEAGTVGGTPCSGLEPDGVDTIQTVAFENADQIQGTYQLIVNKPESEVDLLADDGEDNVYDEDEHLTAVDDQPFSHPAVFAADLHLLYETPRIEYETDVRAVPGDADD